jgi:glycosyltransferase involved in cell wall biosynthesis
MTYPLVSVGVAVYNGEKTIKKSLASIFNQTYKNLEILIIDDNSTDNSFQILKKITNKKKNVRLFKNKKNMGISYTYSKLVKISKGKYFAWNPQDDFRSINYFDSCVKKFSEGKDIVLCQGYVKAMIKGKLFCKNTINSYSDISNNLKRLKIFFMNYADTSVYGLIDRKKLLKTNLFMQQTTAPANLLLSELILKGKFSQVNDCFFTYNGTIPRKGPQEEYWRHNKKKMPLFHSPFLFNLYKNIIYIIKSKNEFKIIIIFFFIFISFKKKFFSYSYLNPDVKSKIKPLRH